MAIMGDRQVQSVVCLCEICKSKITACAGSSSRLMGYREAGWV